MCVLNEEAMKVNNKSTIVPLEMRIRRGILGVSRLDRMRNKEIRRILHLVPIENVMYHGWSVCPTCPKRICKQRQPQSGEHDCADTRVYQTTRESTKTCHQHMKAVCVLPRI